MQKPDKKGKPIVEQTRNNAEEVPEELGSEINDYTFNETITANKTVNAKTPSNIIRTNNVSRPAKTDANIVDLQKKASMIKPALNTTKSEMDDISMLHQNKNIKYNFKKEGKSTTNISKNDISKPSRCETDTEKKATISGVKNKTPVSAKEKSDAKSSKKP